MKKNEIKVGDRLLGRVAGRWVPIIVQGEPREGRTSYSRFGDTRRTHAGNKFTCLNEKTGRTVSMSAVRMRPRPQPLNDPGSHEPGQPLREPLGGRGIPYEGELRDAPHGSEEPERWDGQS